MPKQSGAKSGTARIRFIMLEAEIPEGDLSQVTQAIQNALKPTQVIQQKILPPSSAQSSLTQNDGLSVDAEEYSDEDVAEQEGSVPQPKRSREPKIRRFASPEVLSDVDLNSEPSWKEFAALKAPESDIDKYLVVAEWFKSSRGITEISADHVFTCFKRVNWSTNKPDFSAILRACKSRGFMHSGTQRGFYAINHLGSSRIDEMNR